MTGDFITMFGFFLYFILYNLTGKKNDDGAILSQPCWHGEDFSKWIECYTLLVLTLMQNYKKKLEIGNTICQFFLLKRP
jgi:hypothetical protein